MHRKSKQKNKMYRKRRREERGRFAPTSSKVPTPTPTVELRPSRTNTPLSSPTDLLFSQEFCPADVFCEPLLSQEFGNATVPTPAPTAAPVSKVATPTPTVNVPTTAPTAAPVSKVATPTPTVELTPSRTNTPVSSPTDLLFSQLHPNSQPILSQEFCITPSTPRPSPATNTSASRTPRPSPATKTSTPCKDKSQVFPSPNTYLKKVPVDRVVSTLSRRHGDAVLQARCVQQKLRSTKREMRAEVNPYMYTLTYTLTFHPHNMFV